MQLKSSLGKVAQLLVIIILTGCTTVNFDTAQQAYEAHDYATAYKQFKQLASQGNPQAEESLGNMYLDGDGVTQDYEAGVHWLTLAAGNGSGQAQYSLGNIYATSMLGSPDYAQALQWWRKAADNNVAGALMNIGALFEAGKGVPQSYLEAKGLYEIGADDGDARAMTAMGGLYAAGHGVPQDYGEAIHWFMAAAKLKEPHAAEILGYLQFNGFGQPKDPAAAMEWYQTAADEGDFLAQLFVASVYRQGGFGIAKDPAKSQALFERAADREARSIEELQMEMRAVIDANKSYPEDAIKAHAEGTVVVSFDLFGNRPTNVRVDHGSGYHSLDKAAIEAVKASIFPRRSVPLLKINHFVVQLDFSGTSNVLPPAGNQQCSQLGSCLDS